MDNFEPTQAYTYGLLKTMITIGAEVLRDEYDFTAEQAAEWTNHVLLELNKTVQTMPQRAVDEEFLQ